MCLIGYKYGAIMLFLVSYTDEMCGSFLHHHIQKLRQLLVPIFAVKSHRFLPVHFVWGESVFTSTASCITHLLKALCFPWQVIQLKRGDCSSIALFESKS